MGPNALLAAPGGPAVAEASFALGPLRSRVRQALERRMSPSRSCVCVRVSAAVLSQLRHSRQARGETGTHVLAPASGLQHRGHRYRMNPIRRFDVLHQKQGSAALNAIAAEDEAAMSDRHRHFLGRQRVEKFRQLSMKALNSMSALIHRSVLATARASIDLRRRARNIRTLARLGHHRRSTP